MAAVSNLSSSFFSVRFHDCHEPVAAASIRSLSTSRKCESDSGHESDLWRLANGKSDFRGCFGGKSQQPDERPMIRAQLSGVNIAVQRPPVLGNQQMVNRQKPDTAAPRGRQAKALAGVAKA